MYCWAVHDYPGSTLLALVNDLLDVAKAESGRLHVDLANVDLPKLFGRLRGQARPMAEGKPVEVVVSAAGDPDTPGTILTDEVALTSILRNLLSNGIKYTDRGEVRLSARVAGPRLQISVADTGIGIPAGLSAHVFEEFYQVPGVRRGGTGLGLPYARRLARILGDLQIVNCGHMPPLLTDGKHAVYVGQGGLLLGLPMHEPHVETTFLPPGGTLLLMTDGLVEDREVFLDVNMEKLRVAAQEVSGAEVEAFSNHLMSIFGPREDDVAMIAVRRVPVVG